MEQVDGETRTVDVPEDLYDQHSLIKNGTSITKRMSGEGEVRLVDSLYVRSIG